VKKIREAVEYRTNVTVFAAGKQRPVILGLNPEARVVSVRLLGQKGRYTYPIDSIFHRAVQAAAEALVTRRQRVKRGF